MTFVTVCMFLLSPRGNARKIYLKASLPKDFCFLFVKYFNELRIKRVKQKIMSIMGFTFKIENFTDILLFKISTKLLLISC